MPIQPAALDLLAALAPVLERWGRWYLFGVQAVIVHGVPRLSADVDVTLALTPEAPERFAADVQKGELRARRRRCRLRPPDARHAVTRRR